MTDPTEPPARRRASRKPGSLPVYAASAALFLGTFGFLGVRMAGGQDPALGTNQPQVAQAQQRRVLVRKVLVTRHVTVIRPAAQAAPATVPAQASVPASAAPPTATPSPARASAPAPTPSPAPAPVQTSTS